MLDHNPYLFACTTDSDCTNSQHMCWNQDYAYSGTDPNGWFCNGLIDGDCSSNADCTSNICQGKCNKQGGAGTVCMNGATGDSWGCSSGCQCIPFENFGYCQCS
jgi:hypothetical protein